MRYYIEGNIAIVCNSEFTEQRFKFTWDNNSVLHQDTYIVLYYSISLESFFWQWLSPMEIWNCFMWRLWRVYDSVLIRSHGNFHTCFIKVTKLSCLKCMYLKIKLWANVMARSLRVAYEWEVCMIILSFCT